MSAHVRLSAKGQVVIPKSLREQNRWTVGTHLEFVSRPDGVLLRVSKPGGAEETGKIIERVRKILAYSGPRFEDEDYREAIAGMFTERADEFLAGKS